MQRDNFLEFYVGELTARANGFSKHDISDNSIIGAVFGLIDQEKITKAKYTDETGKLRNDELSSPDIVRPTAPNSDGNAVITVTF